MAHQFDDSECEPGIAELFDERPFLLSMPVGSPPAAPCPSPVGSPPRFQVPLRLTSPRFDECSYVLATPVGSPPAAPCPSPVGSPPRFQVPQRLTSPRSLASLGPGLCPSPGDSPPRYQIPSRFTSPRTPFGSPPPGPCPSPVGSPPRFQIPSSLTSPRSPRTPCPSPAGSPLAAPTSAARYPSLIPCPGLERRTPSPTRATMEQVRAMLRNIHPRQRPAVEEVDVDDMPESAWDMINRLEARRTDLCDGVERGPSPPICPPISDYAMLDPIPTLEQVTRWLRKLRARGPIMPPPGYPHLQPLIIPSSPQPGSSRMWTPPRRVLTADEVRQRLNLTTPEGGYGQGPCPTHAPRRSPREFLSPRRVQSMFEKSRVGDHFMPISHSTLDLSGYLPAAYSAYETRESGGESPIFKPGQAMTRTMVIPRAAPCPGPSAGGQTFDVRPTGQTFNVPPRVLGQTFTAPPRILYQTYAAPPRVLDRTYSAPPRILDQTYAAPPRVLDRTYTALPHILDQTYAAPPRVLDRTYTAPPHVLDRAFSVPPGAGQQVRRPRRYSRDYSFYDPALEEVERRLNLTNICPTPYPSPQQPCPSPAGSPREFMSPRRVQSMFEISRVGDHFMPVAHSSLDLCREYLPLAYSPTTFRASGGLSPVFRPGQAMTRTVIIPHPRYINPRDYYPDETSVAAAGGQTFDIGPRRGPGGQTFNVAAVGAPVLGQTYACPGPSAPAPSGLRQTFDIGPRRGPGGQTFNVAAVGAPVLGQTYACPGPFAPAPSGLDQTFTIACTPPPVPRPVRTFTASCPQPRRQLYALVTPRVTRSLPRRLGQPLNVTYVVPGVSHSGATPQFCAPDMDTTPLTHRAYNEPFTGADRHVRRRGRLIPVQPQVARRLNFSEDSDATADLPDSPESFHLPPNALDTPELQYSPLGSPEGYLSPVQIDVPEGHQIPPNMPDSPEWLHYLTHDDIVMWGLQHYLPVDLQANLPDSPEGYHLPPNMPDSPEVLNLIQNLPDSPEGYHLPPNMPDSPEVLYLIENLPDSPEGFHLPPNMPDSPEVVYVIQNLPDSPESPY